MKAEYLIIKRGLYYRPNSQGYTGLRDEAGRYTLDYCQKLCDGNRDGLTYIHENKAEEFMPDAYHDSVIKHLIKQRDDARESVRKFICQNIDEMKDFSCGCEPIHCSCNRDREAYSHVADMVNELELNNISLGQNRDNNSIPAKVGYTNYRGEYGVRNITPIHVYFGSNSYHTGEQWFIRAFDHDKNAERDFALADFGTKQENGLDADMIELITAGRDVVYVDIDATDRLDKALEAFATRVPWPEEPDE